MPLKPETEILRQRLQSCSKSVIAWSGTFYRATTLEYANRHDLLAGEGSRNNGGRWNAAGSFNAVYGSLKPETAMAEALGNYRDYGIPVAEAMPLVFVAIAVEVQVLLDFTNHDIQRKLGVSRRRMRTASWSESLDRGQESITQALGRIAFEEQLEGILVPSARVRNESNVVLFPRRRRRGSSWKIVRARKLPRKGK